MGKKFHFNDEGVPGECDAKIQCRFGLSADQHYETKAEAQAGYEENMKAQEISSTRKKVEKDPTLDEPFNNYAGGMFRGKTVGETVENIRVDYETVADAEPVDPDKVLDELTEGRGISRSFDPSISWDYNRGEYVFEIESTYSGEDEPLQSEYLIGERYASDNYTLDSYAEDTTTWSYSVPGLSERVARNAKRETLQPYYETLDNPDMPVWAALPLNDSSVFLPLKLSNMRRSAESSREDINVLKRKLQASISKGKSVGKRRKTIETLKTGLTELENAKVQSDSAVVRKAIQQGIENDSIALERAEKNLKVHERAGSSAALKKLEEDISQKEEELQDFQNGDLKREEVKHFIDKLASHHPASNGNTRKAAARKWLKEHPESFYPAWEDC